MMWAIGALALWNILLTLALLRVSHVVDFNGLTARAVLTMIVKKQVFTFDELDTEIEKG